MKRLLGLVFLLVLSMPALGGTDGANAFCTPEFCQQCAETTYGAGSCGRYCHWVNGVYQCSCGCLVPE